jgi:hypothetical protein
MNTVLTSSFHIPCFFIYFFLRVYNSGKTSRDRIHLTGAGWSLLVRACAALRSYAFKFYSSFLHLFLRSSFFGLRGTRGTTKTLWPSCLQHSALSSTPESPAYKLIYRRRIARY